MSLDPTVAGHLFHRAGQGPVLRDPPPTPREDGLILAGGYGEETPAAGRCPRAPVPLIFSCNSRALLAPIGNLAPGVWDQRGDVRTAVLILRADRWALIALGSIQAVYGR